MSFGITPSPQSKTAKPQLETILSEILILPGGNIPKYKKETRTKRDGINVWDIYEYNGSEYKINNNLSIDANKLLDPPVQPSQNNNKRKRDYDDDSGGVPGGV